MIRNRLSKNSRSIVYVMSRDIEALTGIDVCEKKLRALVDLLVAESHTAMCQGYTARANNSKVYFSYLPQSKLNKFYGKRYFCLSTDGCGKIFMTRKILGSPTKEHFPLPTTVKKKNNGEELHDNR